MKLWARVWCLVFLTHSVYTVCLFISYASPLILFSSLFLTYLLPFVSFPLRIDPLRFHARCCKKMTKPGFSFLCLFCVVVHFFWYVNVCFCCVRFSFFPYKANRCLGKCLLKWPTLSCEIWSSYYEYFTFQQHIKHGKQSNDARLDSALRGHPTAWI